MRTCELTEVWWCGALWSLWLKGFRSLSVWDMKRGQRSGETVPLGWVSVSHHKWSEAEFRSEQSLSLFLSGPLLMPWGKRSYFLWFLFLRVFVFAANSAGTQKTPLRILSESPTTPSQKMLLGKVHWWSLSINVTLDLIRSERHEQMFRCYAEGPVTLDSTHTELILHQQNEWEQQEVMSHSSNSVLNNTVFRLSSV